MAHGSRLSVPSRQLGPYPMEKLKRVDEPTTRITGNVRRFDQREEGFNRALRGDFGPFAARERQRFVLKQPLSAALVEMDLHLTSMADGEVASAKAPIPKDPEVLNRHIKSLGYFLRADIMGICRLPQWAVYSHDMEGQPIELNH